MTERIHKIRQCLETSLAPEQLHIEDESDQHIGHAGAKSGRGHFALTIKSKQLSKQNKIKAHQMIYHALGELMNTDIHALRIKIEK